MKLKTFFIEQFSNSTISNQGFTLVELLVVIAILAIVLAVSLPSFNAFTKSQYLTQSAEQLLSDLRTAQSRAQNGVVDSSNNACWGVSIPSTSNSYTVGSVACNSPCDTGLIVFSTSNFSGTVTSVTTGSTQFVVFSKISGLPACPTALPVTLTLTATDGSTKAVVVGAGGNMYVQ